MAVFEVLWFLLFIFWLLLIGRIIVEFIRTFARDWKPTGFVVVVLEAIFTVTDPPVKLLRRLIPPRFPWEACGSICPSWSCCSSSIF